MRKLIITVGIIAGIYYFVNYMFTSGKFDELLDTHPEFKYAPVIEYYLGNLNLVFGKWDSALYRFGRIVKNYPDSKYAPMAFYLQGKTYADRDSIGEAIKSYEQLIKSYPESEYAERAEKRVSVLKVNR